MVLLAFTLIIFLLAAYAHLSCSLVEVWWYVRLYSSLGSLSVRVILDLQTSCYDFVADGGEGG
jgi:hypothetical protein